LRHCSTPAFVSGLSWPLQRTSDCVASNHVLLIGRLDRSAIRSAGSRRGPPRRRVALKPPSELDVPGRARTGLKASPTRGRVDHEDVTKLSSTDGLTRFRYYHRTVGNEKPFETETVVCGGRERNETDVSEVIEQKTKTGWRLHSSEKLANGRTRLTFRRPIVR
jgi:hypothetical protein